MSAVGAQWMPHQRTPYFRPDAATIEGSALTAFIRYCEGVTGRRFEDYSDFDRFASSDFRGFWRSFVRWSGLVWDGGLDPVCVSDLCEDARFFPGLRLNYAENLLAGDLNRPAVTSCHRGGYSTRLTRRQLHDKVVCLASSLEHLGVGRGDRIVALARNNAEVIVAALAAAALGATFSSCSHDMGAFAVLERFAPLAPAVLVSNVRPEPWDHGVPLPARVAEVAAGLPTLEAIVALDDGVLPQRSAAPVHRFAALTSGDRPGRATWPRLPFEHPLFVLFSSGTTGPPKCIVHGAGGTLLEHVKEHRLHCDLKRGDKLFFQTTCGWMMWNWQLSALASGAELVVFDGPLDGPETLWRIVAEEHVTVFGTSPAYLRFCEAAGYSPRRELDLVALRGVLSTGSILHPQQYDWVAEHVKPLPLQSISGGTDIVGCFVLGNPNLCVYRGQAQCRSLGLDVRALLPPDKPEASVGELVCANPFPSRPVGFHGDASGGRFHASYFAQNPGMWTHGDQVEFTAEGGAILHGRSDGVLNIRGIRVGPAEIYRALQGLPEIVDALAVEQRAEDEPGGARLILLVVLRPGLELGAELAEQIRARLAERGSSALVPARIAQVAELPVTHSGKLSEAAARDAVNSRPALNRDALRNPECLEAIWKHPALQAAPRSAGLQERGPSAQPLEHGLETELQRICEQVLGAPIANHTDSILGAAADSLTVLNIILEINRRLGVTLPLEALFAASTIKDLAAVVRGGGTGKRKVGTHGGSPRPRIRAVEAADIEPLCRFLCEGFRESGIPAATWANMFNYGWLREKPGLGFVMTDGDTIVGFIGAIYSERSIAGKTALVCNHTSFYVLPQYRGRGAALMAAAVSDGTTTFTGLTPSPVVERMFNAFNFTRLDAKKIAFLPLANFGVAATPPPTLHFDQVDVRRVLDEQHKKILEDHAPFDCLQFALTSGSEWAFFVVKRRVKRTPLRRTGLRAKAPIPYSDVLYCSNPGLFTKHLERVKITIMARQRTLLVVADERLFPVRPKGISFKATTLYRSPNLSGDDLDRLYSELVLLPI